MNDRLSVIDGAVAGVAMRPDAGDRLKPKGVYHVQCLDKDGKLKWEDDAHNLVTDVGANEILDQFLAGSAYTASLAIGLMGSGSAAAGDTMASHAGWLEVGLANAPTYTGNRKVPAFSAAASRSKTMSAAAVFAITSTGTVNGMFLNEGGSTTKDNTTGKLISVGAFANGARSVLNGDTINVTYTLTV